MFASRLHLILGTRSLDGAQLLDEAGVADVEEEGGHDDHPRKKHSRQYLNYAVDGGLGDNSHSLQPDEQPLIMDQGPTIPITQLINPVRASDQDENDGKAHEKDEQLERHGRVAHPLRALAVPVCEFQG